MKSAMNVVSIHVDKEIMICLLGDIISVDSRETENESNTGPEGGCDRCGLAADDRAGRVVIC